MTFPFQRLVGVVGYAMVAIVVVSAISAFVDWGAAREEFHTRKLVMDRQLAAQRQKDVADKMGSGALLRFSQERQPAALNSRRYLFVGAETEAIRSEYVDGFVSGADGLSKEIESLKIVWGRWIVYGRTGHGRYVKMIWVPRTDDVNVYVLNEEAARRAWLVDDPAVPDEKLPRL